jgi:glyoxylase-like metal-dependent hydrolase (beta-lactamase superfamily II)
MASYYLPPGIEIFERGWLSANSIFHFGDDDVSLVDSGYCAHQTMTVDLVKHTLQSHRLQALKKVVNTHLHSDHCGGNAALSQEFACDIYIPQAEEIAVREWNEDLLSYQNLGQECPRFKAQGVLIPGESIWLGQYPWKIFSAPGHDPHSIMLYQADYQILISADALWESGFGVVFPELWGEGGFEEVAQTLRLIEGLPIQLVIPGHGKPFTDIAKAIAIAYSRLDYLSSDPTRNARHGAKVLLKYKLLEWRNKSLDEVNAWVKNTPTLKNIAQQLSMDLDELAFWLPQSLVQSGVATIESGCLVNIG